MTASLGSMMDDDRFQWCPNLLMSDDAKGAEVMD